MSSGIGRGRGWLNLKQNQNCSSAAVGNLASPSVSQTNLKTEEEAEFTDMPKDNDDLLVLMSQINLNSDGKLLDQNIRCILKNWKSVCQTPEDVENRFHSLYKACYNDSNLASKLVVLVTTESFVRHKIHDCKIRNMFLTKLQLDYENRSSLRKTNRSAFRNVVSLLSEYYRKAFLPNCLTIPLSSCLEMLLEEADLLDLQIFTTQLYLNGSVIKEKLPEKFTEIMNNVRSLLVSGAHTTKEAQLWLLLAIDVANRFGSLPGEIIKFYEEHLGATALARFQVSHCKLSVETNQNNKTLESFQSNVNILQVSTASESTADVVHVSDTINSSIPRQEVSNNTSITGRPILGAGARLNKYKLNEESNKKKTRDRDNRGDTTSADLDKPLGRPGCFHPMYNSELTKGWEHDDRFNTD